jgi:DNA-directed RNA polymerase specialized sigma24 family protein
VTDHTKPLSAEDASYVAFVESAWQRHVRLAMLLTGDRLLAEELLQDSLVRMYERWRKLSRLDDVHAYLRRSLVNNHTSVWRRRRRESLVAQIPDRAVPGDGIHHDADELRRALLSLPARQRAVVVLGAGVGLFGRHGQESAFAGVGEAPADLGTAFLHRKEVNWHAEP